jgi:hypothetical protein
VDPAQLAAWVGAGTGIAALVVSVASARYSRQSLNLARQVAHRADKPSFDVAVSPVEVAPRRYRTFAVVMTRLDGGPSRVDLRFRLDVAGRPGEWSMAHNEGPEWLIFTEQGHQPSVFVGEPVSHEVRFPGSLDSLKVRASLVMTQKVWPARKNRVWSIDVEKAWADPDPS